MQFVKIFYLKLNVLFHGKSGLESFQERPTQTYLSVRVVLAREEGVVTSDWGCQEELRSILRCEVRTFDKLNLLSNFLFTADRQNSRS